MTTKTPVNVDALLGNLLGNLDKGIIGITKEKKEKKVVNLRDESIITRRMDKPTITSKKIVLLVHKTVCACGECYVMPNKHLLVEKVDKWGNLHRTRFLLQSEIDSLPRTSEVLEYKVDVCLACLADSENVKPVVDDSAKELDPVSVDKLVENFFNKIGRK